MSNDTPSPTPDSVRVPIGGTVPLSHGGPIPRLGLGVFRAGAGRRTVDAVKWALEDALDEGLVRAIGVSNYMVRHLEELMAEARIPPAVNQIELHPFNFGSRRDVLDYCQREELVVEAFSPLTKAQRLDDPVVGEIARAHRRTPAQILIRYGLEKGAVSLPKSANRDRIRENADVFDFRLDADEMARLDDLDEGLATSWDPTDVP